VIGCNGVPLGVPEVYGAVQTHMIDTVISTASALVALQWHGTLNHVTQQTFGILINGLVMNGSKWKSLPPEVGQMLVSEANKLIAADRLETRAADERAYQVLLQRGYVADHWAKGGYEAYRPVEKRGARAAGQSTLLTRVARARAKHRRRRELMGGSARFAREHSITSEAAASRDAGSLPPAQPARDVRAPCGCLAER
jgi:TRAP-type C4-dicarboxylate transport system substrate-binding protein